MKESAFISHLRLPPLGLKTHINELFRLFFQDTEETTEAAMEAATEEDTAVATVVV